MLELDNSAEKKINLERVKKLRGRCYSSPGGPYRWRHAFEDVLTECLSYLDENPTSKNYEYIESFTLHAQQAMSFIEDRKTGADLSYLDKGLCKIFIERVCIKSLESRFQNSPDLKLKFTQLFFRFIDFEVSSSKFSDHEKDIIRILGLPPFAERWSGYSMRSNKLISDELKS